MAEITDQEKTEFYDRARKVAAQATHDHPASVVLQADGELVVGLGTLLPAPQVFRNGVIDAARKLPQGMAVGIVLGADGQPKILPNPLPCAEGPFVA